jgi:hypothetical protein
MTTLVNMEMIASVSALHHLPKLDEWVTQACMDECQRRGLTPTGEPPLYTFAFHELDGDLRRIRASIEVHDATDQP